MDCNKYDGVKIRTVGNVMHRFVITLFVCYYDVEQGCQTYGPRAKSGPLRGCIRPAGWFCEI